MSPRLLLARVVIATLFALITLNSSSVAQQRRPPRNDFGGPIELGPDDKQTHPDPPDSIVADRALRQLDPGMLGGRIELDVDQLFTRVQ